MFFTKSQVSNINQLSGNISVYIREEMGIKELAISLRIPIGAKKTKMGSEVKVMTEKKDQETQQIVEVEFKFFWEERIDKEECNEKIYTWTYGLVKFMFEIW